MGGAAVRDTRDAWLCAGARQGATTAAEAGALVYCAKAMIGTLVTLNQLGFMPEGVTPLRLEVDSQAAIDTLNSDWIHRDSRWNSIRISFLREFVRELLISLTYGR